ncbi:MAG: hypothetical protein ACRCYX_00420 [Dermatophilaceae bacterium]
MRAAAMDYVVDSAETLRGLRSPGRRAVIRRVRLGGPLADASLEKRLNRAYFACGCDTGSVAVGMTLLVCVSGALTTGLGGAFGPWHIAGYLAGAALAGKAFGLAVARTQLRTVERQLAARLADL